MKKKIAIIGSTGSIGQTLLNIIKKNKHKFEIILLTADKSHETLLNQAKEFEVKNLIITDKISYEKLKYKTKFTKIKVFNEFNKFDKIFKSKVDYVMSSIIGIEGLEPTINIIKYTNKIAIANKESIICGWNLIKKELKKNRTKFIPVDSEHFSIWYSLQSNPLDQIEKIYITASGGPLLKLPIKKIKNATISLALKHPNWKMGKKISIDSATMMNKVFEVIEASKIFDISYNKISILIEPSSYIHALIKFNDGMIKIIAHDTTMTIPIFNTLNQGNMSKLITKKIDTKKLNKLNFSNVDLKRFPSVKILKQMKKKDTLFETVIVSANDELVNLYLNNTIKFDDISKILIKLTKKKEFAKYKWILPNSIKSIENLSKYVRLKVTSMSV